jgi:hypothetical protein
METPTVCLEVVETAAGFAEWKREETRRRVHELGKSVHNIRAWRVWIDVFIIRQML